MEDSPLNNQGRPARKTRGVTAELRVAVELLSHGFAVSWPFGDMEGYDLIADSKTRLTRLQVRSTENATARHKTWKMSFRKGHAHREPYSTSDADFFIAVVMYPEGPAYYVIPVSKVKSSAVFFPPGQHPRYPDKWKTCKWEEYRNRWDLLR